MTARAFFLLPVDPIIIATTDSRFDDDSLSQLNADMIDQIGTNFSGPNDCAVTNLGDDEYYGQYKPVNLKLESVVLICHTDMPYYGRGYERGFWPELAAIIEMLRRRVPESTIWYGRDDSESVEIVDNDWLDKMWDYWSSNGCRPYSSALRDGAG